ncbi:hypothetical protein FKN01_10135 [Streptomyces sp. 130]|uniref:hypothetical protein n=1 Tax=Streptomyces sp. 130 TaxID=2591006 RepID=UPI00117BE158|nr:hypothetical protein [Streptomyces sp. 130]TRV79501.1 hypothetical protein FKN01_10135 [Streptomyces sp. 130]
MNRIRVTTGIGALLAALVIALLPLPATTAPARADSGSDSDSAVTVSGKKGQFNDFSDLRVTVGQTKNLRAQGIRITWTGGKPTQTGFRGDYLQLMQCWGDDETGPTREQCQFGAAQNPGASSGFTNLRQLSVADPAETQYVDNGTFESYVPFRPADGGKPTTGSRDWTYFSSLDTNEEPYAITHQDGTGEFTFAVQTLREASQLGCGEPVTKQGKVTGRSCWLVIVPRGDTDTDGVHSATTELRSSPLSASNWATRMVVPLDFLPVGDTCPADRAERRVIGSELVTDAMSSWQPAVCSAKGGAKFAFTQGGEEYARETIAQPRSGAPGLAFTVAPAEGGGAAGTPVHAPLAAGGLAIGFFVEMPGSGQLASMKLTPRLVAKMLTSSYQKDVTRGRRTVPEHIAKNPLSLFHDPEFQQLNPAFADWKTNSPAPMSLMVQLESSDTSALVWEWLRSDTEAREFLSGTPDPWGTKINPYFEELGLATDTTVSDFPKADPTRTSVTIGDEVLEYGTTEVAPYVQDMHEGALRARRGNNGATTTAALGGNGTPAKLVNTQPLAGQRMVLALVDLASAERYGLQTAALRNADGRFVAPTDASVLAGVAAMKDSAVPGVLDPSPGVARGTAYPLAAVVYAAAYPTLPAADREDYAALIRYAAGAGQTPGLSPGQLPPGYAPLPAALRTRALAAADRLQNPGPAAGDPDTGPASGPGSTGGTSGATGSSGSSGGSGGAGGGAGGAADAGGGGADPDASRAPAQAAGGPGDPAEQNVAARSAGLTPATVLGIIRWVLLGVLVAGGAAALCGPVLLRLSLRKAVRAD